MAKKGDQVTFTSVNDGKDHNGTVREVIGNQAVIVDAPTTRRGWEIAQPGEVRPR